MPDVSATPVVCTSVDEDDLVMVLGDSDIDDCLLVPRASRDDSDCECAAVHSAGSGVSFHEPTIVSGHVSSTIRSIASVSRHNFVVVSRLAIYVR